MIRLYGMSKGNSSWARVTAGWREGLQDLGVLAGVKYFDVQQDEEPDGYDAPFAVCIGSHGFWPCMSRDGRHRAEFAVLAPNSTWLPRAALDTADDLSDRGGGLLPPSGWGYDIIRRAGYRGWMKVVPHGVSRELLRAPRRARNPRDPFHVVHFTSSAFERKATAQLVAAWKAVHHKMPEKSTLHVVSDYYSDLEDAAYGIVEDNRLALGLPEFHDFVARKSVVCQPSRSEGFGLVPLEAAAVGVPSIITYATGHLEYADQLWNTSVHVAVQPYGPIDDGPDAQAPVVLAEDVAAALVEAHEKIDHLTERAFFEAEVVQATNRWSRVIMASGLIDYCRGLL